jgi:hypothetical protein
VAAFVFSLVGVGLVAIPLAIWGLVRTAHGPRRGRGFAIAALCVSAAWAVISALAVLSLGLLGSSHEAAVSDVTQHVPTATAVAPTASTPTTTSPATSTAPTAPVTAQPARPLIRPKRVYWVDLKPTMCVRDPNTPSVYVTVVDCRAQHQVEVTLRTVVAGSKKWPGDSALESAATAKCKPAFEKYVGIAFDDSRLEFDYLTADPAGWRAGDRTLVCFVLDPANQHLTRALRGAKE